MSFFTLQGQIKNPRSKVFRKLEMKRRQIGSGTFESSWQDITKDVIKWGSVRKEIDATRINQFKFANINLVMNNEIGLYNPYEDENSLWYNYSDQQRTLIRVSAGFIHQTLGADGVWDITTIPTATSDQIIFSGYISGDINVVGNNQINIPIVPLTECFRQFSAARLSFYNTSLTASDFITGLRDQQDSFGSYIFRPFFGDTTSNWVITSTTNEYSNLSSAGAEDITNLTTWDVVQKLSEAENFVPFISADGVFKFSQRGAATASVFSFFGGQSFSSEYGTTIKKIGWYGKRYSKYYSRVSVKYRDADTSTSYEIEDSQYIVSSSSGPWTLGEKTLEINNIWIPTSTLAESISQALFTEFSAIKYEIEFTTSFVPHLDVLDTVNITYDPSPVTNQSLWDVYNWSDTVGAAAAALDLEWDDSAGDALKLSNVEFKLISIDINLDSLETKFIGRR